MLHKPSSTKVVNQYYNNVHSWIERILSNRGAIRLILSHLLLFIIGLTIQTSILNFSNSSNRILVSKDVARSETNINNNVNNNNCREYGNGWNSIEVFYGKTEEFERLLPENKTWFAQVRQDIIVSQLFNNKRNGYFLDLAANDATHLSNTYSLETKLNWTGLCIEPNPKYWDRLAHRTNCQVVAAVVGERRMDEISFMFTRSAFGGIVGDGFDNKKKDSGAVTRYTTTLYEILQRFNVPRNIDYLSLDVEGAEDFIMQNFPLHMYTISVMTVERPKDSLKTLLMDNGYVFIGTIGRFGETLWVHETMKEKLELRGVEDFFTNSN